MYAASPLHDGLRHPDMRSTTVHVFPPSYRDLYARKRRAARRRDSFRRIRKSTLDCTRSTPRAISIIERKQFRLGKHCHRRLQSSRGAIFYQMLRDARLIERSGVRISCLSNAHRLRTKGVIQSPRRSGLISTRLSRRCLARLARGVPTYQDTSTPTRVSNDSATREQCKLSQHLSRQVAKPSSVRSVL